MKTLLLILSFFLFVHELIGQKKKPKGDKYNTKVDKSKNVIVKQGDVKVNTVQNINIYQNGLIENLYDEKTGGKSFPIVYATIFKDSMNMPESFYMESHVYPIPSNKYLLYLDLENKGEYKLEDVSLRYYQIIGDRGLSIDDTIYNGTILAQVNKRLKKDTLEDIKIESTEPVEYPDSSNMLYYYYQENPIEITVRWRTKSYIYKYQVLGNGTKTLYLDNSYTYNGKVYKTKEELYDVIMKERKMEKEKSMKLTN